MYRGISVCKENRTTIGEKIIFENGSNYSKKLLKYQLKEKALKSLEKP